VSLADNIEFLRRLPKLNGINGLGRLPGRFPDPSRLAETVDFGANPGALRMFSFVPNDMREPCALVVVLHGCTQTAAGYDMGAGWSMLAERYGFALLMPEQQPANNPNTCFNWFLPEDTTRDQGEAASIRQMIRHMARNANIDGKRIFVTGLSAGGAMTSVMLATYPEIFAGGAIIAGLPYGIASMCRKPSRACSSRHPAPRANSATSFARLPRTGARGRNCRCGTAAPTAPCIRRTPTRSSSSGSTCTDCRRRRCPNP